MTTVKIKLSIEIEVEVLGNYVPASSGTYEQPRESSEFMIEKVLWQDKDISEMLNIENYDFAYIEEQCLEEIENER
jgi:hypothetical protein